MSTIPTTAACHGSDWSVFGRRGNSLVFWTSPFLCSNGWFQAVVFKDKSVNRRYVPNVGGKQSCTPLFSDNVLDWLLFQKDGHCTNMPARDAKLISVAARTRDRLHVHDPQSVLIVPTLNLERRPCMLMNTQRLSLLHRFVEHFRNFCWQPVDVHCLIFVTPSFEKHVELFNVRGEQPNRILKSGLVQPLIHRLGYV